MEEDWYAKVKRSWGVSAASGALAGEVPISTLVSS